MASSSSSAKDGVKPDANATEMKTTQFADFLFFSIQVLAKCSKNFHFEVIFLSADHNIEYSETQDDTWG